MNLNATLIGQSIAFAIFVWFTWRYVWPPILAAMKERQDRISDGLAAAEKGARALEEAAAKSDEAVKEARAQAQEILGNANKQATQTVEEAKDQAKAEGERIVAAAKAEVEREIASAREALRQQVGQLAVAGASQILKREVNADAHADILKDLAAKV